MNETIQVTLDSKLVEELRQTTAQQGVSVESVVADLAQQYLREVREKKLQKESEHYLAMHTQLKEKYLGQHIAIHEGQLVDHDSDVTALIKRLRQRYGRTPIFVAQIDEKPIREFVIRSPRLVRRE